VHAQHHIKKILFFPFKKTLKKAKKKIKFKFLRELIDITGQD